MKFEDGAKGSYNNLAARCGKLASVVMKAFDSAVRKPETRVCEREVLDANVEM